MARMDTDKAEEAREMPLMLQWEKRFLRETLIGTDMAHTRRLP